MAGGQEKHSLTVTFWIAVTFHSVALATRYPPCAVLAEIHMCAMVAC